MTDSPRRVDVMVLYSPAAIAANTDELGMKARVQQAVQETNWAFIDSGVDVQIHPVHVGKIAYRAANETGLGPLDHTLNNLTTPNQTGLDDDSLDSVHSLRTQFNADVVILIIYIPPDPADPTKIITGGLSKGMYTPNVGVGRESLAFAVVTESGLTGSLGGYFFAHELGHLMGSHHNLEPDGAFDYSHGRINPNSTTTCGWRTIMAQNGICTNCPFIPRWSNPRLLDDCGNPMGSSLEDNARSLNQTRHVVANFRCGSPPPTNVWMKDTWGDTGAEPDSAQASAAMWRSPYIWVRNAQDTNLDFQHEHQNPIFGQSNWAYVKLHNSGPDTDGKLELYSANASTEIPWIASWKLISSEAVSAFPANSTKIVEIPWSNVPGLGHYCLLARWNSTSDPMATPEGPDVAANVRGNNNIVWRNLNIVDLAGQASSSADLMVGNPDDPQARFNIEVRAPANVEGRSFLRFGTITVKLDRVIEKSGQLRGATRRGSKAVGKTLVVYNEMGAELRGLQLGKAPGRLHLTFRRPANKPFPVGVFRVDVVQTRLLEGKKVVVGGVSYEVHTERR